MKKRQITIKDIAKELGISPSTVSRALKDHPDISIKTKLAVNELATKLSYKPNEVALSLRNSKSNIIGVIIPELIHHFFSSVISGIDDLAYSNGYSVMIAQSNENYLREVKETQVMYSSRVAGLLVSVSKETKDFDHFRSLEANGLPIVFFDRVCKEMKIDKVVVDDFEGAYKAVEYLIKTGCKKIVHFGASQHLMIGRNRQNGYLHALFKYGIPIDDNLIFKCDDYDDSWYLTEKLIKSGNIPDAIFAVNDATAIGALQAIRHNGLRVPEDISIIGFTNGKISTMTEPPLTTIDQHGYEMGQIAVRLLLNRLEKEEEDYVPETKVIKTDLIIRKSTLPLK
ncbi:MAG: LacI family DNA-binding transcriptional regulator [Bacteroidales bacterium]|nr:LacI family DNA-binding transcriptional regulator [Bacteroidales bacterium]MBN2756628.1 LacI family DNA-binding transcriptional regulator [Bacteroidales bacterium]